MTFIVFAGHEVTWPRVTSPCSLEPELPLSSLSLPFTAPAQGQLCSCDWRLYWAGVTFNWCNLCPGPDTAIYIAAAVPSCCCWRWCLHYPRVPVSRPNILRCKKYKPINRPQQTLSLRIIAGEHSTIPSHSTPARVVWCPQSSCSGSICGEAGDLNLISIGIWKLFCN